MEVQLHVGEDPSATARARAAPAVVSALMLMATLAWPAATRAGSAPSGTAPAGAPQGPSVAARSAGAPSDVAALQQSEDLRVGLQSGETSGCVAPPSREPATLDCTLLVGTTFDVRVTAYVTVEGRLTALPLRIEAEPLPAGARLADDRGATPVAGRGRVSGRLTFSPTSAQVTAPDTPWVARVSAVATDDDGGEHSALFELRFHVLEPPASQRVVVAYIFEDHDADGRWEPGEAGLGGRTVRLRPLGGEDDGAGTAVTDALGRAAPAAPRAADERYVLEAPPPEGWRATTPDRLAFRAPAIPGGLPLAYFGQRRAAGAAPRPALRTERGCLGLGDPATYRLGEPLEMRLSVGGVSAAWVRLTLHLPGGAERTLVSLQRIAGETGYVLRGSVGPPTGEHRLRLAVWDEDPPAGQPAATVACRFRVVTGGGPAIAVEPEALSLSEVAPGGVSAASLRVRNIGGAPLTVRGRVQGGPTSAFAVAAGDDGPFVVPAGGERSLGVLFRPAREGTYADWLLVESDDPDRPLVGVRLSGRTEDAGRRLDVTLSADRGCLEAGDDPLYVMGEAIGVRLRVNATDAGQADVRLELVDADGRARPLLDEALPTGVERRLDVPAAPPAGAATLRLTASVGALRASAECSLRVAARTTPLRALAFQDENGNGIWDGRPDGPPAPDPEPPLPGQVITLGGPETGRATTDASGAVTFTVSVAGDYTLALPDSPGWRATTPRRRSVRIWGYAGERPPEALFGLRRDGDPGGTPGHPPTPAEPTPTSPPSPTPAGTTCVERGAWQALPLGRSVRGRHAPGCWELVVPTRWGGRLELAVEAGTVTLLRPGERTPVAGPAATLDVPIGLEGHGALHVLVEDAPPDVRLTTRFTQGGEAAVVPWNAWHWPLSRSAPGPHLHDVPGPLTRFDALFNLGDRSLAWERRFHRPADAVLWWGHGWGMALASALLAPAPHDEVLSQDDREALAAAFFERFGALPLSGNWPAAVPRPGPDPSDAFADDLHRHVVEMLRIRRAPLVADLRQESGGGAPEVWPHVVYGYESVFAQDQAAWREAALAGGPARHVATTAQPGGPAAAQPAAVQSIPGAEDPRWTVVVTTHLRANALFTAGGASAGDPTTTLRREQQAVYALRYAPWGEPALGPAAATHQDWRAHRLVAGSHAPGADLWIPQGLADPRPALRSWTGDAEPAGENPMVTSELLEAIGLRPREDLP